VVVSIVARDRAAALMQGKDLDDAPRAPILIGLFA